MKNKPCAFCGSTEKDNPRTKGHVLQDSIYPVSRFEKVQRITVPECRQCGEIWKDAEGVFWPVKLRGQIGDNVADVVPLRCNVSEMHCG
jgi:hypothetical protein